VKARLRSFTVVISITLALYLALPARVARASAIPWNTTGTIDASFDGAASVDTADFDRDGNLDVLAAATTSGVSWWQNNGSSWSETNVSATGANDACTADVDRDGAPDILVASTANNTISVIENDGLAWNLTANLAFNGAAAVQAVDMDNDGRMDILGAGAADGISWWQNTGGNPATWSARQSIDATFGDGTVSAADLDGDGDQDVISAAAWGSGPYLVWWENDGSGSGWTMHTIEGSPDHMSKVHTADVDNDGDLDVIAATDSVYSQVYWFQNDGAPQDGGWVKLNIDLGFLAEHLHAADLDGDGDTDILGASTSADWVVWWENDGGSWTRRTVGSGFGGAAGVSAADLDRDGDLDVLGAGSTADDVAWWENETIHRNATFPPAGEHTVDGAFDGATSVYAADVDGDGDIDVLGAAYDDDDVAWWENMDGAGTVWTEHTVDGDFDGAVSVHAADLDGDGDTDVLGAASNADNIAWWENTDGAGTTWTEHTVDGGVDGVHSVFAADVDGDGDRDILGAARDSDFLYWWENNGTSYWQRRYIEFGITGVLSVYVADVDGDGSIDVLSAARDVDDIVWWEYDGVSDWWEHTVDGDFDGAVSVYAADVDGDGDTDVLGAAFNADEITWWENTNGIGTAWVEHTVDGAFDGAYSVYAADVDGDGDTDVLGAADVTTWWENTDGAGTTWTVHTVDGDLDGAVSVQAADVDGDGDTDVLGAAWYADDITWWENRGGQFGLDTADTSPDGIASGGVDDLLRITVRHNGRTGDGDIELSSLELLFEESAGDPLTTAEANALVANLYVYRDDGSGAFEIGSDTLVTSMDVLTLTNGVQTVPFANGDPNVRVVLGAPPTFFVVVELTADAGAQTPFQLRLTHLTESSSTAQDRDHGLPLSLEYAPNTASEVTAVCFDLFLPLVIR
jgi:hypothetical protein